MGVNHWFKPTHLVYLKRETKVAVKIYVPKNWLGLAVKLEMKVDLG